MTLLIKNCKLLDDGKEVIKNIYISRGMITKITSKNKRADKVLDANYNFVIPGVIDPHVHFRDPGLTHKETLYTGSRAAATGGITTFLDMPNTIPPTLSYDHIEEKRMLARKSVVNYGFYIGAAIDNHLEIRKARSRNIPGTKLFMNLSTGKMMVEDKASIRKIFENSKLVAVHAEGSKVEEAIQHAVSTNTKLYLCHISTADEINTIKAYRNGHAWVRNNVYVEVTPHHLFLTEKDFEKQGAFAKMIPGLKKKKDQDALWHAIRDGTVDTIGTDHAPHTSEEKKAKENQPAGVPGVETILPLMLNAVNKGRLSLERLVELTSKNPARIFGIRKKGGLGMGYDADLTIIDMEIVKEVANQDLKTKCGWSPFDGRKLKGWPVTTIVNGKVVYNHGKLYKNKGREVMFR